MWVRTLERRAGGLPAPSPPRSTEDVAGAQLSPAQREAIRAVAEEVARSLGVAADAVSPRCDATVQMLASDSQWFAEARAGMRVEVALHDGTQPPEFEADGAPSAPLAASEAVAFDRRARVRRPRGDWRRALVMAVRGACV